MAHPPVSPTTTPVIAGFHPDPTICRGPGGFYVATSSFEYRPGVPIYFSTDLRHWQLLGNALDRPVHLPNELAQGSSGVYAPTLRHRDGTFFLVTTDVTDTTAGHLLVTSTNPRHGWSDPVPIPVGPGIDPDLSWDEHGTCHLTWSAPGRSGAAIWQCQVDETTGSVLTQPTEIWAGTGGAYTEGPHLFAIGGRWYLVAAEGGTERGHCVVVARGPGPGGPFEADPANPLLSHRSTNHPVQNVGHGDLVPIDDDTWAMVHLGVRPRGGTPGFHVNGRETFLTWLRLRDGWFELEPRRASAPEPEDPPNRDFVGFATAYDDAVLHPRWVSPGLFPQQFAALNRGRLALTSIEGRRCALVTRVPDPQWQATAVLDTTGGSGRLLVTLDDRHWYGVGVDGPDVVFQARAGELGLRQVLGPRPVGPATVSLTCSAEPNLGPLAGPDRLTASLDVDGHVVTGPSVDGRYLTTEVAGGFTGRMLGVEVTSGALRVQDFRYTAR
jgi:hypothetical protein